MELCIKVLPKKLLVVFSGLSCLLVLLHLITGLLRWQFDHPLLDATWIFDVSGDVTIQTWYSALMLGICSALLTFIGWTKLSAYKGHARKWFALGAIFLTMSIDEVSMIHETLGDIFGELVNVPLLNGLFHYVWVIPGFFLVVSVVLFTLPLALSLPSEIKILLTLSAVIFVGGGLGIEMINGKIEYLYGGRSMLYALGTALEELCEMLGVSLLIYTLTVYIKNHIGARFIYINLVS